MKNVSLGKVKTENGGDAPWLHLIRSLQFLGWLTGVGSGMRIAGPEDVKQQYKEYLQSVLRNY